MQPQWPSLATALPLWTTPPFRSSGPACAVIAAGVALDANVIVQDVAYPALRERLLAAKQILTP